MGCKSQYRDYLHRVHIDFSGQYGCDGYILRRRFPALNNEFLGVQHRTVLVISLSIFTGWLVNRGPKMAAHAFGPATASVLLLLWVMVFATIWKYGIRLPRIDFTAFHPGYFHFTIGGYVRILAVMTGIEVFANLVAAYDGEAAQKSRKAFNSLLIIMGTAAVTMLIVGPAIYRLSDSTNTHVSVFTQTMDALLPEPFPHISTLIGVAVLMSASAASAQGLQNLALGLKHRNYIPHLIGQRNRFEVADKPVWIEVGIVSVCFLLFGTHEETYLTIYAAGVFILLSMTGWAVTKRLIRTLRDKFSAEKIGLIAGSSLAALLTTSATAIIFYERFLEGAWTYFLFIPILYATFTYFRNRLGEPSPEMEYLGLLDASQLAGFGFGQYGPSSSEPPDKKIELTWKPEPVTNSTWRNKFVNINKVAVLLDGSKMAARALPTAMSHCQSMHAEMLLLASVKNHTENFQEQYSETYKAREIYLSKVAQKLKTRGFQVEYRIGSGFISDVTAEKIKTEQIDLVITTTAGKSGAKHWRRGGASRKLVQKISTPILLVQTAGNGLFNASNINRILVALDGSIVSESTLPYARSLAKILGAEIILTSVPAVLEVGKYRAPAKFIEELQTKANTNMSKFLKAIADSLRNEGYQVRTIVTGSLPARTIISVADQEDVDLIMLTSRGRGKLEFLVDSVAQRVVEHTDKLVFMMPVPEPSPETVLNAMTMFLPGPIE